MDWCVDGREDGAVEATVTAIADHLARRAVAGDDDPLPVIRSAFMTVLQESPTVWARVTWDGLHPLLDLRPLAGDGLPGTVLRPGLTAAHEEAGRRDELTGLPLAQLLPSTRPVETDVDPGPTCRWPADPAGYPGAVAAAIASATHRGHLATEAAAEAGASAAAALPAPGGPGLADLVGVYLDYHRAAGADPWVVSVDGDSAVIANRRCPYGEAVLGVPELCRTTSALLGSFAAQASQGSVDVVIDESLALGDAQCRFTVTLGATGEHPVAHRYRHPPGRDPDRGGFRVATSLQLPRDRSSVPFIRHLVRGELEQLGVVPDDVDDVELALTEACANVIEHAGTGATYDVVVSLDDDRCEIRVVDVGPGFGGMARLRPPADLHAESGRGLSIMYGLMDEVRLVSGPQQGSVVHLSKAVTFAAAVTPPAPPPALADAAREADAGTEPAGLRVVGTDSGADAAPEPSIPVPGPPVAEPERVAAAGEAPAAAGGDEPGPVSSF